MALRARILLADAVVVAVEQVFECGIGGLITGQVRLEQKGFEEPGGVSQVPARRAGFRAGLQAHVFGEQRFTQLLAESPGSSVCIGEPGGIVLSAGVGQGFPAHAVGQSGLFDNDCNDAISP